MQLKTVRADTAGGALYPIPDDVPCPDALRAASEAYLAATGPAQQAAHDYARAKTAALDAASVDRAAQRRAENAGERRSSVELTAPAAQAAEEKARAERDKALMKLATAEVAYADALFDHRREWIAMLDQRAREARVRQRELLDQLEPELTAAHVCASLAEHLGVWRYDREATAGDKLARLRDGMNARRRPDFTEAERERARTHRRMQNVREAADRNPDGREHVSNAPMVGSAAA